MTKCFWWLILVQDAMSHFKKSLGLPFEIVINVKLYLGHDFMIIQRRKWRDLLELDNKLRQL